MTRIIFGLIIGYIFSDIISQQVPAVMHYKVKPEWITSLKPEIPFYPQESIQQGESLRELIM